MHKSFLPMLLSLGLMACFPPPPDGGGGGGTPDAGGGNPCTRQSAGSGEGFPFDVATFDSMLLGPLQTKCQLAAGCHAPTNTNRFTVFKDTDSTCAAIATFNEVFAKSDYQQGGAASLMVKILNGTAGVAHTMDAELAALFTTYIDTAKTNFEAGGGGGGGGDAAFDRTVFSSQIQPVIDNAGCIGACHNATSGSPLGDFALTPNARPGSNDLEANVLAVVEKIDLGLDPAQAQQAVIYFRATDGHGTRITDATALQNLETWIAMGLMGQ